MYLESYGNKATKEGEEVNNNDNTEVKDVNDSNSEQNLEDKKIKTRRSR